LILTNLFPQSTVSLQGIQDLTKHWHENAL